ncbi:hypothetical protein N7532_010370 [Penicillium argentinense]|uniref:Uncharacterized protein n=1 Tax=Penicillium argentinense TaxID=1131581 RepID=A0A9W9EPV0_9EURO|nr:uncharacterized protein N7532_010370 [Penicillium argentinense]KAJ5085599.1 hypothetical protein N7532_010370 [Penicillium argentinense]
MWSIFYKKARYKVDVQQNTALKRLNTDLKKPDRRAHIRKCVQRVIALDLYVPESQLKFCYECMKWLQASQMASPLLFSYLVIEKAAL